MADTTMTDLDAPQPMPAQAIPNGISTDTEMKEEQPGTEAPPPSNNVPAALPDAPQLTPSTTTAPATHTPPPPAPMPALIPAPPSRASPHPQPSAPPAPPPQANPHGSPTRVYLNQNVTPHLLEGMKYLAFYEPEKPLKWLADFLAQKSKEVEGT